MVGKILGFGFLAGAVGLVGGWFLWGGPDVSEVRYVKTWSKGTAPESSGLAGAFQKWSEAGELDGALLGFCVLDEKGEVEFASPLAGTALCPASAFKTLTAGAALGLLGEDFRFETLLLARGGVSPEGIVSGDLVLKGGGDPTLSEEDLVGLAERAVEKGLKRVEGSLRVDDSIFPGDPVSDHWVWGDLGNAYGAGAFGLNVGHNRVELIFEAGEKEGDSASYLRSEPNIYESVKWKIGVFTGPAGSGDRVMVYSSPGSRMIRAVGTVPLGAKDFAVGAALPDPSLLAYEVLKEALEERGVVFSGDITGHDVPEVELARHRSERLPEIIDHMQRVSDNLEAQCLFLMLGVKEGGDPAEVMTRYWEGLGVSFKGLRVLDGSGLARATMIRPVDLARVNFLARKAEYGEEFFASLPGNSDGTIRSKRGAMSGVRTEVGFVKRGGKEYTFALMGNGLGGVDFWKMREGLLEEIGR